MPLCPECGDALLPVDQDRPKMLNADQFDSVKAGDWYCKKCCGDRGKTGHRYFWNSELEASKISAAEYAVQCLSVSMLRNPENDKDIAERIVQGAINTQTAALRAELLEAREKLATAMQQSRMQDTALRVIDRRIHIGWLDELIESALKVGDRLTLDGESINVDELLSEAYPALQDHIEGYISGDAACAREAVDDA